MIETPESMSAELAAWNNGKGIDLESWFGCEGRFALAVGYATIFWPGFVEFEDYILPEGFNGSKKSAHATRKSTEWVMNHLHLDSVQHKGCVDLSEDKLVVLGQVLKEIHEAKLQWQFPDRPCVVEFFLPEDRRDLSGYQLSFWQKAHDDAH